MIVRGPSRAGRSRQEETVPGPLENAIAHPPVIDPCHPTRLVRQKGLDRPPLEIRQIETRHVHLRCGSKAWNGDPRTPSMGSGPIGRLRFGPPCHGTCVEDEGFAGCEGLVNTPRDASEAFDAVEETLEQMTFLADHPIEWTAASAAPIAFDLRLGRAAPRCHSRNRPRHAPRPRAPRSTSWPEGCPPIDPASARSAPAGQSHRRRRGPSSSTRCGTGRSHKLQAPVLRGGVRMHLADCRFDQDVLEVGIGGYGLERIIPNFHLRPASEAAVHPAPIAQIGRSIAPTRGRARQPQHRIDEQPAICPAAAPVTLLAGKKRLNPRPLPIPQGPAAQDRARFRSRSGPRMR